MLQAVTTITPNVQRRRSNAAHALCDREWGGHGIAVHQARAHQVQRYVILRRLRRIATQAQSVQGGVSETAGCKPSKSAPAESDLANVRSSDNKRRTCDAQRRFAAQASKQGGDDDAADSETSD